MSRRGTGSLRELGTVLFHCGTQACPTRWLQESVWDYLALDNVKAWLYWFLQSSRHIKATGTEKAYTPSYINSLVRCLRALGKCFVGDPETDEDAAEWFKLP